MRCGRGAAMPEPEAVLWGRAMDMPGDAAPDPAADDVMPSHRWLAEPDPSPSPAPEPWAEPSPEPGGEPGARPEGEGAGVSYLYPVPFPQGVCVDVHTIALGVIFSLLFVAFLLLSPGAPSCSNAHPSAGVAATLLSD